MDKHVTKQFTMALIVARPGPLRHSLQTLITTLPQIEIVAEAKNTSALLRMGVQVQPDLVLIEADLPDNGVQETIKQIRREWTHTRSIVLVETAQQQQAAVAAGADAVLYKGYRANRLIKLIEALLQT